MDEDSELLLELQSIFDRVADHLLTQNAKSITEAGCAYRGDGGLKCALGVLIKDEFYDSDFEGCWIAWPQEHQPREYRKLIKALGDSGISVNEDKVLNLLAELQHIHDRKQPVWWRHHIFDLAKTHSFSLEALHKHFPTDFRVTQNAAG